LKWIGKFELKVVNGLLGILIRDEVLVWIEILIEILTEIWIFIKNLNVNWNLYMDWTFE
jgi:hypothetical protein